MFITRLPFFALVACVLVSRLNAAVAEDEKASEPDLVSHEYENDFDFDYINESDYEDYRSGLGESEGDKESDFGGIMYEDILIDDETQNESSIDGSFITESFVYVTRDSPHSIVSFDPETRAIKDISRNKPADMFDEVQVEHGNQKVSPDGNVILFTRNERSLTDNTFIPKESFIYAMKLDGSNPRKVFTCKYNEKFDFGPDGKSILFVAIDGHLKQIDLDGNVHSIRMVVKNECCLEKPYGIHAVSYGAGHVYWRTLLKGRVVIWRKNLLVVDAVPKLVYKTRRYESQGVRYIGEYSVSPDGKRLLVFEYTVKGNRYLVIVNLNDNDDVDEKLPVIYHYARPDYTVYLDHFFWYTDSAGIDWIYAERYGVLPEGLVRIRADAEENSEFELVIPGFRSYSGVSVVPKASSNEFKISALKSKL